MNSAFTNSFNSFKSFLNFQSKFIIFTAVFYALLLSQTLILGEDFILQDFKGRMIGIATLNGFDVGARVALFYKTLGVLFGFILILNVVGYIISRKIASLFTSVEIRIINYVSLAAILLFLIKILGYNVSGTMSLVYFLHKFMLIALLIRSFLFKKNRITLYNYAFIILVSLSLNFLILDIFASLKPDFFNSAIILSCLLAIVFNLLFKNAGGVKQSSFNEWFYCLFPIAFLPLVHVLKDELFLIFKAHHSHFGSPLAIQFFLLLIVTGWILFRRKVYKKKDRMSQRQMLALRYFPVFVFSIVAYAQYSYFVTFDGEQFEMANRVLPVMEFKLFDVIPTLEKFNTHLVSDYFFPGIYTILNGGTGYEMLLYDFFYLAFSYVLYYYLVFYISRNAFLAMFSVLLFPLSIVLLPEQFSVGIVAFFALQKMFSEKQSLKKYLVFFAILAATIVWRIDLGYTCIIVMTLLTVYYHFVSKNFKVNALLLVKSAAIVGGAVVLIIGCFCLYRDMNLFKNVTSALNYMNSAQTWGYSSVGQSDTSQYKLHYFIFPAIVSVIIIALLLNFKTLNKSRNQRFSYLALLFISVYYLANFNRGLIRHSLIENTDHYASSYVYLILAASLLVFFRNQKHTIRYAAFFGIGTFFLINYKVPVIKATTKSFFENALTRIEEAKTKPVNLSRLTGRILYTDNYKTTNDSAITKFINLNTAPDETFIDFSNTPMIYFYTKKITPGYFFQNPSCAHNDFLQNRFIADLKNYKTPFILFSNTENNQFDAIDAVPNTLRHYRISEYFYQNYKPYVVAGRYHVWKANDAKEITKTDTVYKYVKNPNSPAPYTPVLSLSTSLNFKTGKKYIAKFIMANPTNIAIKTRFSNNDTTTLAPEYIHENLAIAVIEPKSNNGVIEALNLYDQVLEYQIIECDYVPDLSFEKPTLNDFSLLPYIWGTFDKNVIQEPILFDVAPGVLLQKNTMYPIKIADNLDKTSGNTVLISCRNNSGGMQKLSLSFGYEKEKNKTKIDFIVIPSGKDETYAIRISSSYKWYNSLVNQISLSTESEALTVSRINITKGM